MATTTIYRFVGNNGEFYEGIPARDIRQEEYNNLTDQQKDTVNKSALYVVEVVEEG